MAGNAVELATAYVSLTVEASKIAPEVSKQLGKVDKDADKAGKSAGGKFSGGFSSALKKVGGLAAAYIGAQAIKGFVTDGVAALGVIEKLGAQTEAVIKSTGGGAGVTRKSLDDLAASIERVTSVEAESVTEGANLLLTFTNIKNEAGKGNDVFDQTVQAMTNLSVATGTDAKGAALQLGKALNDPIKGVSALQRVGVSFTEAQKDQIKALVESGDVMGAQKVILKEMETQFGGSAEALGETFPGKIAKLKNAFGEVQETIIGALLPAGEKLVAWASEKAIPAIQGFIEEFRNTEGVGGKFRVAMEAIVTVGKAVVGFVTEYKDILIPLAAGVLAVVAAIKIWRTVTMLYTAAQTLLNVVLTANPIGLVILAIVALVAIFVVAWKNSEKFRRIVTGAWEGIKAAASAVSGWFTNTAWPAIKRAWEGISKGASDMWTSIKDKFDKLKAGVAAARDAIGAAKDAIAKKWSGLKDAINKPIIAALSWISKNFIAPLNKLLEKVGISFRIPTFSTGGAVGTSTIGGLRMASGGAVPGFSPHARADNIPAMLTAGEYVLPVNATKRLASRFGGGFLEQLRRGLPGYADGGPVDWLRGKASDVINKASTIGQILTNPAKALSSLIGKLLEGSGSGMWAQVLKGAMTKVGSGLAAKVRDFGGGTPSGPGGAMNWRAIWSMVQAVAPEARMTSNYRPGAITASGFPSKHGQGRAVDLVSSNMMATFRKLRPLRPWSELYYSPAEQMQLLNGRSHVPQGITRRMHYNHIHAAMASGGLVKPLLFDNGGILPEGTSLVRNATGAPEPLARVGADGLLDSEAFALALRKELDGLQVVMDGQQVGRLVTAHQGAARANGMSRR